MAEDPVQSSMGDYGRWQLPNTIMMFVYKLPLGWHTMAIIFLAPKVPFHCTSGGSNATDPCSDECTKREFDRSVFEETIVTEWDLVCDRKYLASLNQSFFMLGILIGSPLFGFIADKIGRLIPLFITIILITITGIVVAFCNSFIMFNIVRFINALAVGGGLVLSFVSMMEIVGKPLREPLGISFQMPHWLGHLTLPLFAYFLRNWHQYQLAISIASLIALPALCLVRESPRWLFSTGRIKRSAKILTQAAKLNGLTTEGIEQKLSRAYETKNEGQPPKKSKFSDLFRTPNIRCKTLVMCYNWLACGMGFYGIAQFSGYLGKDVFVTVAISAALEIPSTVICIFLAKYWGRKPTMILSNLLTGIAMVIIACLPSNDSEVVSILIIILVSIAIAGTSMAFANAYLYTGELFPTVLRSVGMGITSMVSRVGSIISPFVANIELLWLSSLIFGIVPLVAAALCFFLPETKGQPLPESVEDAEKFGRKEK